MRVWPKNETVRKTLKHPSGAAFRQEGPGDWPDDSFTYRRIVDGDVLKEDPGAKAEPVVEKRAAAPRAEKKTHE